MKGRTNITDGIFLNATTEQKTIKSGETIVAGDFVEYETISDAITLKTGLTNPTQPYVLQKYDTNNFVFVCNGVLYAVTFDGENAQIIASYDEYNIAEVKPLTTSKFVVAIANSSTYIAGTLILTSNGFTVESLASNGSTSSLQLGYPIYIDINESNVTFISSDSSYDNFYYLQYTNNTISYVAQSDVLFQYTDYKYSITKANNVLYKLCAKKSSYGSTSGTPQLYQIAINYSSHTATETLLVSGSASTVGSPRYIDNVRACNNKIIGVGYDYVSGSYVCNNLIVADLSTDSPLLSTHNLKTIYGVTSSTTFNVCRIENIDNEHFVSNAHSSNRTHTVILDYNIDLVSNVETHQASDYGTMAYIEGDVFGIKCGTNMILTFLDVTDNLSVLTAPTSKEIVSRWRGTNKPIGVAKDGGTGGDTISVYIPSSQY